MRGGSVHVVVAQDADAPLPSLLDQQLRGVFDRIGFADTLGAVHERVVGQVCRRAQGYRPAGERQRKSRRNLKLPLNLGAAFRALR